MREIVLPADELNEFDLPRVCVVTGQTENVEFKPVKFAWYPRWTVALVIVNVLIAAIVASILTKRVKGHLPFTEEAYKRWWMGRVFFGLSFLVAIALFIGGCVMIDSGPGAAVALLIGLALATPIAAFLLFARNKGPVVQRIAEGRITLKLPSEEAALQIEQHLFAGQKKPSALDAVARSA
ncbi:MAG: hypothetical protein ACJ8AT_15935 [Hyalangium sp.]|uniref:hypothetical protein n=1 Tax=Hyalangium sp. TaxID=2028555 RepID=UPI0038999E7F